MIDINKRILEPFIDCAMAVEVEIEYKTIKSLSDKIFNLFMNISLALVEAKEKNQPAEITFCLVKLNEAFLEKFQIWLHNFYAWGDACYWWNPYITNSIIYPFMDMTEPEMEDLENQLYQDMIDMKISEERITL